MIPELRDHSRPSLAAAEFVAEDDRFRNLLLRLAALAALPLNRQVGFFLADAEIALQDPLRAVEHLACFEPLRELRVLTLEPRHLDLGADQEADGGDQLDVPPAV